MSEKLHEVIRVLQGLMAALERRTERWNRPSLLPIA